MKTVWIIGGSERTSRVLEEQLVQYVQDKAFIKAVCVDSIVPSWNRDDLIVLSSSLIIENLADLGIGVDERQLVVGKRTVNPDMLERVVALSPGTNAVFINDTQQTTDECVQSLLDLGLNYITWHRWYPGLDVFPESCTVAVVAGEPQLVPPQIAEIIDIHVRIFGFGTIAEILQRLGIAYGDIDAFSQRYLAKIVSLARNLARKSEEAQRLSGHLGSVIDSLSHGILVYDEEGRVSVCNEEVRALLTLRQTQGVGDVLAQLIHNRELLEFLDCRCGEEERMFRLSTGQVVVHRFDLNEGGHTVAVFRTDESGAEQFKLGKEYRKRGHVAKYTFDDIIGESAQIVDAKRIASRLAETDLAILIQGETGTGKELFASAIHSASSRARGPFLAVDLGSLSDDLIESELFGYEEGAFTGARKGGKPGLFELAHGGTLFLDEIGNISSKVQTRLLRVLQEKELMRVGGSDIMRVDVRVIAATNENLLEKARMGLFREDLIFRLRMGWLRIPPLRERAEDMPALVQYFLRQEGAVGITVSDEVLVFFREHEWLGNVRELKNMLTYMLAVRNGPALEASDIPAFDNIEPAKGQEGGRIDTLNDEDAKVLEAIAFLETSGQSTGRESVAGYLSTKLVYLGPGSVRAAYARLAVKKLVTAPRGRRGTQLTRDGWTVVQQVSPELARRLGH